MNKPEYELNSTSRGHRGRTDGDGMRCRMEVDAGMWGEDGVPLRTLDGMEEPTEVKEGRELSN